MKKDEEFLNHKEEMRIENERERTSSMMDCKHNVLHKLIQLKMEKEIINLVSQKSIPFSCKTIH